MQQNDHTVSMHVGIYIYTCITHVGMHARYVCMISAIINAYKTYQYEYMDAGRDV
jgi:hypothetical protein